MKNLKIEEKKILLNGKEIKDGTIVTFNYGRKKLEYNGFFYIADILNNIFGADFLISDKKRESWKFYDGYIKGFKINKVSNFKII